MLELILALVDSCHPDCMKPRSYRRVSNTIRLDFDPLTWDALKAAAREQNESMERMAYRLLQAALPTVTAQPQETAPETDVGSVDTSSFAVFRMRDEREKSH